MKGSTTLNVLKFIISLFLIVWLPSFALAANCNTPNSIISATNSVSGGFEYVTFKFKKPPALPQFTVTNVVPPFIQDGSGDTIVVSGSRWTQVKFEHMDWTCSTRQIFALPKPAIKAVKNIGQFEGQIVYVIGRSVASHFISARTISVGGFTLIRVKFRP